LLQPTSQSFNNTTLACGLPQLLAQRDPQIDFHRSSRPAAVRLSASRGETLADAFDTASVAFRGNPTHFRAIKISRETWLLHRNVRQIHPLAKLCPDSDFHHSPDICS
jgi:hypothetical protein